MLVLTMLLVLGKTSVPGMSVLGWQECQDNGTWAATPCNLVVLKDVVSYVPLNP